MKKMGVVLALALLFQAVPAVGGKLDTILKTKEQKIVAGAVAAVAVVAGAVYVCTRKSAADVAVEELRTQNALFAGRLKKLEASRKPTGKIGDGDAKRAVADGFGLGLAASAEEPNAMESLRARLDAYDAEKKLRTELREKVRKGVGAIENLDTLGSEIERCDAVLRDLIKLGDTQSPDLIEAELLQEALEARYLQLFMMEQSEAIEASKTVVTDLDKKLTALKAQRTTLRTPRAQSAAGDAQPLADEAAVQKQLAAIDAKIRELEEQERALESNSRFLRTADINTIVKIAHRTEFILMSLITKGHVVVNNDKNKPMTWPQIVAYAERKLKAHERRTMRASKLQAEQKRAAAQDDVTRGQPTYQPKKPAQEPKAQSAGEDQTARSGSSKARVKLRVAAGTSDTPEIVATQEDAGAGAGARSVRFAQPTEEQAPSGEQVEQFKAQLGQQPADEDSDADPRVASPTAGDDSDDDAVPAAETPKGQQEPTDEMDQEFTEAPLVIDMSKLPKRGAGAQQQEIVIEPTAAGSSSAAMSQAVFGMSVDNVGGNRTPGA